MKKLIVAALMLFSINAIAANKSVPPQTPSTVRVLFHHHWTNAIGLKYEADIDGWAFRDSKWEGVSVSRITVVDVSEGFTTDEPQTAIAFGKSVFFTADKFVGGHLYKTENGILYYLFPKR